MNNLNHVDSCTRRFKLTTSEYNSTSVEKDTGHTW